MQASELTPLVYDEWPGREFDPSTWLSEQVGSVGTTLINNKTVVDELFGWGTESGVPPPIFGKLPMDYNTVLNHTAPYGREAIYLLGKSGTSSDYVLCSIEAYLTPHCSTRYNVSSSGATLEAVCEDTEDGMQYLRSQSDAPSGNFTISTDWVEGAVDWSNSLSLGTGLTDGNASNARLLMQLVIPSTTSPLQLNPTLPSPAEALAVMAGCTLLMGTQDAPFVEFWNYTAAPGSSNILDPGVHQSFNASLQTQQYASGGNKGYKNGFFVVLVLFFVLNLVCLSYLITHRALITDFSDPVNLFSLAINSPPSEAMAGSCKAGPETKQYKNTWYVASAGDHLYIENAARDVEEGRDMQTPRSDTFDGQASPLMAAFHRVSQRISLL